MNNGTGHAPYEELLGAIGSQVDERKGWRISLVEQSSGFDLQYHLSGPAQEGVETHLKYEDLVPRRPLPDQIGQVTTSLDRSRDPDKSSHYQEFLAAIGFELDQLPARDLYLVEADGSTYVQYEYVHPSADYISQEREAVLGPSEQRILIEQAVGRQGAAIGA